MFKEGDLVEIKVTGKIIGIYPGSGYLVLIHGEQVPVGFDQVKLLTPESETAVSNPLDLDPGLNQALTSLQRESGMRTLDDFEEEA